MTGVVRALLSVDLGHDLRDHAPMAAANRRPYIQFIFGHNEWLFWPNRWLSKRRTR